MGRYHYYIGDNLGPGDNKLSSGPRILKIRDEPYGYYGYDELEGPYDSINQLKKRSAIFKELCRTNTKRVQQILRKENIVVSRKKIVTETDHFYTEDYIRTFEHITKGDVKSNQLYGIHYFDSEKMRVIEILNPRDKNGVWKAKVEAYDANTKGRYEKESSFFPEEWSLTQLFHECDHADKNKVQIGEHKFISKTYSGVTVHIIMKNDKLVSIYPIHEIDQ